MTPLAARTSTDEFTLWMNGLDPVKVAAEESFHSERHRRMVDLHEFEKTRIATQSVRADEHDRKLAVLANHWAIKDRRSRALKQKTTEFRTKANPIKFTDRQLEISEQVMAGES